MLAYPRIQVHDVRSRPGEANVQDLVRLWRGMRCCWAFETQRVIGLRLAKMAEGGPAAQVEAQRMVMEKSAALAEAATTLGHRRARRRRSFATTADASRRTSGGLSRVKSKP
jgi:hypothetical protein